MPCSECRAAALRDRPLSDLIDYPFPLHANIRLAFLLSQDAFKKALRQGAFRTIQGLPDALVGQVHSTPDEAAAIRLVHCAADGLWQRPAQVSPAQTAAADASQLQTAAVEMSQPRTACADALLQAATAASVCRPSHCARQQECNESDGSAAGARVQPAESAIPAMERLHLSLSAAAAARPRGAAAFLTRRTRRSAPP